MPNILRSVTTTPNCQMPPTSFEIKAAFRKDTAEEICIRQPQTTHAQGDHVQNGERILLRAVRSPIHPHAYIRRIYVHTNKNTRTYARTYVDDFHLEIFGRRYSDRSRQFTADGIFKGTRCKRDGKRDHQRCAVSPFCSDRTAVHAYTHVHIHEEEELPLIRARRLESVARTHARAYSRR